MYRSGMNNSQGITCFLLILHPMINGLIDLFLCVSGCICTLLSSDRLSHRPGCGQSGVWVTVFCGSYQVWCSVHMVCTATHRVEALLWLPVSLSNVRVERVTQVCVCNIPRGKGDYHRLGHGSDDHVRRPRQVQGLQGKKVIAIATGSLHCVCCTEDGKMNHLVLDC